METDMCFSHHSGDLEVQNEVIVIWVIVEATFCFLEVALGAAVFSSIVKRQEGKHWFEAL